MRVMVIDSLKSGCLRWIRYYYMKEDMNVLFLSREACSEYNLKSKTCNKALFATDLCSTVLCQKKPLSHTPSSLSYFPKRGACSPNRRRDYV